MSRLMAIAPMLTLAAAASAQPLPAGDDPSIPADPIYHVEIVIWANDDVSRAEEDLYHDIDRRFTGPVPELLRLPSIEIESVPDLRPFPGRPIADTPDASPGEAGREPGEAGREPGAAQGQTPVADAAGTGQGAAPNQAVPALEGDRLALIETGTGVTPATSAELQLPPGFRPLGASELELGAVSENLARRGYYTVLAHAGWAQSGVDTDRSVPVDLGWLGITNPAGTIEVYLRRFLHARFELEYFQGASATRWRPGGGFGIAPLAYAESFRLSHERNAIRSNEPPHFIDHPLIGVLIQITPAPEPEDAAGNEDGVGPAG